jgi:hypothetical protein
MRAAGDDFVGSISKGIVGQASSIGYVDFME